MKKMITGAASAYKSAHEFISRIACGIEKAFEAIGKILAVSAVMSALIF